METPLRQLLGPSTFVAIDVGASHGLLPHWTQLLAHAEIYLFEPRAKEAEKLRAQYRRHPKLKVFQAAVSNMNGPKTLYETRVPTGSSLLKPDLQKAAEYLESSYFHPWVETSIDVRRLDAILDQERQPEVHLLKVDVQGTEVEVLEGLGERLDGLLGLEIEIGLVCGYENQPDFPKTHRFLIDRGLSLFDVRPSRLYRMKNDDPTHYQKNIFNVTNNSPTVSARVWELDCVYFKSETQVLGKRNPEDVLRLAAAYGVYRYFSEAHLLLERAASEGIFTKQDAGRYQRIMISWHDAHRSFLDGRGFLPSLMRKILNRAAPKNAPRWAQYMYQDYPCG